MKSYCIILASGVGARFGVDCPKQFARIKGRMIIEYTLAACDCDLFDEIILVVAAPYMCEMEDLVKRNGYKAVVKVVEGGASRKESCERGVEAIADNDGFVVIHNGVQPFVTRNVLSKCLSALEKYPAVTSGAPCVYTVLETDDDGLLRRMAPRARCFSDLGPECFRLSTIREAFAVGKDDTEFTNLTGIVMKHGLCEIYVVEGSPRNIKITYPEDVAIAEKMLEKKRGVDHGGRM